MQGHLPAVTQARQERMNTTGHDDSHRIGRIRPAAITQAANVAADRQLARTLSGSCRTTVPAIQSCRALCSLPATNSTNEVSRVTMPKA